MGNQDRTILVTGAHGFLGRYASLAFSQSGYTVHGIGHGEWSQQECREWGLSDWQTSEITAEALLECAGKPYAIVHCAGSGSVGFSLTQPKDDFARTVSTTLEVLEYVRMHSPATMVIYPSSASVYGVAETFPISVTSRTAPISPYGVHKLMAEQMVASYARNFGVSAAVIRFFSVFGDGLRKQLLWDAINRLARGDLQFMGTGNERRDWLHVKDAAVLIELALSHASTACPIVNGGTGHAVTVNQLVEMLSRALGSDGLEAVYSGAGRPGDPTCYVADPTEAQAWGWLPKEDLEAGIAKYVAWWRLQA